MVYDGILEGRYVDLKSCTVEDAEFTRAIRQNPQFKDCFPPLNNTIEQQREWVHAQREKPDDYFFVVWDKNGNRIGTISLYNITSKQAEGGRIAIKGNPLQVIEAQILQSDFAFDVLKIDYIIGYVFSDNERALRFNEQMGAVSVSRLIRDNREMIKIKTTNNMYKKMRKKYEKILYR